MLKNAPKAADEEGPPFRMLPMVQLQAVVMDLAAAIEEIRSDVELIKERLNQVEMRG